DQVQVMDAVLVTGGASGLGLATSLYLAERGYKVYAATRAVEQCEIVRSAAERQRVNVLALQLDVTDPDSIARGIDTIVKESGGIYGLVNNAGRMLRGCVEDVPDDEVRGLFEVNVFGLIAVTRQVLPPMRAAGRGRIVTISSAGAKLASFGVAHYCASKCAAEGFGEALELEIAPFGLHSVLIEPGMIKTAFWTTSRRTVPRALEPASAYYEMFQRHEVVADRIVDRS